MDSLARWARFAAPALSALALAGCASMNVHWYMPRGMDLRPYHTYTWGPTDRLFTGDPRLDNNWLFDDHVRGAVEKQLAARGFEKTGSATPDLLIRYHASITQEIDSNTIDRQYSYRDEADRRPYVYEAGTLLIDLVDPRTDRLLWRGWAEGSMDRVIDDQVRMEKDIDEAVKQILNGLPPRL